MQAFEIRLDGVARTELTLYSSNGDEIALLVLEAVADGSWCAVDFLVENKMHVSHAIWMNGAGTSQTSVPDGAALCVNIEKKKEHSDV